MPPTGPPDRPWELEEYYRLHPERRPKVVRVPLPSNAWWGPPRPIEDDKLFLVRRWALNLKEKCPQCQRHILFRMGVGSFRKAFKLTHVTNNSRFSRECKNVNKALKLRAWTFELRDRAKPRQFVSFIFDKDETLVNTEIFTQWQFTPSVNKESLPKRAENPHPRRLVLPTRLRELPGRSVFKRHSSVFK